MAQRDELLPARVRLREGDRRLVGLGPARAEEGLLDASAGRELHELLGQLDDRQRRVHRRHVAEALHLRADRGVHLLVGVARR